MDIKTEFYETAVQRGFYGVERSGLIGKKDNVRKYWEDISIKFAIRDIIEKILVGKKKIRVVDLGCGSGEGFELLTHIPVKDHVSSTHKDFLLNHDEIKQYTGFDISESMIGQGKMNYSEYKNILFEQCDLSKGLPVVHDDYYDLYFSSYASLSHLSYDEILHLVEQIISQIKDFGYIVFDLLGRYSPEWPNYWNRCAKEKLNYNMAYLYQEEERTPDLIETFKCSFWSPGELNRLIEDAARKSNKIITTRMCDRSIFIGRHMDTGIFNNNKKQYRYQVNRLFDRDFRGVFNDLIIDLDYLEDYKANLPEHVYSRINHYMKQWNYIIAFVESLIDSNKVVMNNILQNIDVSMSDDIDMLSWLYRNASRFPVADFWASVMGPQIACVLRNCELNYPDAVGCGHGLFCIVEVTDEK